MEKLLEKLLEQSPLIIFLGLATYMLWQYIKEKNKVIKEKDEQIASNQEKLMNLYGQAVESQNKLTSAIDGLRDDLERSNRLKDNRTHD